MQTFLPHQNFCTSLMQLDSKRLVKQVLEAYQILDTIINNKKAWANHPAVNMWRGYENCLWVYGILACDEYEFRYHKKHACLSKIKTFPAIGQKVIYPPWIGMDAFHSAHRAILLAKNPEWYSQWGWKETPAVRNAKGQWPYVWPSKIGNYV